MSKTRNFQHIELFFIPGTEKSLQVLEDRLKKKLQDARKNSVAQ